MYDLDTTGTKPVWWTNISRRQWVNLSLFLIGKSFGIATAVLVMFGFGGYDTRVVATCTLITYILFVSTAVGMAIFDWVGQTTKEHVEGTYF